MTHDTSGRSLAPACSAKPARSSSPVPETARALVLVASAAVTGGIAWSGNVLTLPLSLAFPVLWAYAPSRITATLVSVAYFLAASRGLPQGVVNYYSADLWPGLALWTAASLAFVIVHAVLWTKRPGARRAMRYGLAAVLMGLPPFGIVGWAHPLTAAGVLFPGWGWFGLAAAAAVLLMMTTRRWSVAAAVMAGLWGWSAATWTAPPLSKDWMGIDLELGQSLGRETGLDLHRDLIATVKNAAAEGARAVVLPESALGFLTPTVERLWSMELHGTSVTVLAGAAVLNSGGYDNVTVKVSGNGAHVLYRERMPVPVSMWQPWRAWTGQGGGAHAHFFANPVIEVAGTRIAPLICYEQLILWPTLQSMLLSPDVIVATGNGWWTSGTSIVDIQKASATAWAKLFGVRLVTAFNI
ncbi:conjugal transfer protein TraB [Mesorhizobium sp. CCNWLW176]|uniref:conjugal transfer protein TraB n=1 Tax=unclassified Mesorhizobium TaxID=325217 RepID=UPI003FA5FBB3